MSKTVKCVTSLVGAAVIAIGVVGALIHYDVIKLPKIKEDAEEETKLISLE